MFLLMELDMKFLKHQQLMVYSLDPTYEHHHHIQKDRPVRHHQILVKDHMD
tara:strand:+ start:305 stop:457 length:153 start_codon:yes stop_codon:yes gene_type:complete